MGALSTWMPLEAQDTRSLGIATCHLPPSATSHVLLKRRAGAYPSASRLKTDLEQSFLGGRSCILTGQQRCILMIRLHKLTAVLSSLKETLRKRPLCRYCCCCFFCPMPPRWICPMVGGGGAGIICNADTNAQLKLNIASFLKSGKVE